MNNTATPNRALSEPLRTSGGPVSFFGGESFSAGKVSRESLGWLRQWQPSENVARAQRPIHGGAELA
jgi:hypothetical protein